ncbi:MAG: hypothetical protein ACAI44_39805, partial [Candidatus Sericytochromatia bacterium]
MTDLLTEIQQLITDEFTALNAEGTNFGGREVLAMVTYQQPAAGLGGNPIRKSPTAATVVGTPLALVVLELELGEVRRWEGEAVITVGDARVEIARRVGSTPVTEDQLLGKGLPATQFRRYTLGGQLYTLV